MSWDFLSDEQNKELGMDPASSGSDGDNYEFDYSQGFEYEEPQDSYSFDYGMDFTEDDPAADYLTMEQPVDDNKETPGKGFLASTKNVGKAGLQGVADMFRGAGAAAEGHNALTGDWDTDNKYNLSPNERDDIKQNYGHLMTDPQWKGMYKEISKNIRQRHADEMFRIADSFPEMDKDQGGLLEKAATGMARSGTAMAIQAFGGPGLGLLAIANQILGSTYTDLRQKYPDAPKEQAFQNAALNAGLSAPVESLGNVLELSIMKTGWAKAVGKKVATSMFKETLGFGADLLMAASGEGLEEYVQSYPQELADVRMSMPNASTAEVLAEFKKRVSSAEFQKGAGESALLGAIGGGMLVGPMSAAGHAAGAVRTQNTNKTQALKDRIDALRQAAEDTDSQPGSSNKIKTSSPETAGITSTPADDLSGDTFVSKFDEDGKIRAEVISPDENSADVASGVSESQAQAARDLEEATTLEEENKRTAIQQQEQMKQQVQGAAQEADAAEAELLGMKESLDLNRAQRETERVQGELVADLNQRLNTGTKDEQEASLASEVVKTIARLHPDGQERGRKVTVHEKELRKTLKRAYQTMLDRPENPAAYTGLITDLMTLGEDQKVLSYLEGLANLAEDLGNDGDIRGAAEIERLILKIQGQGAMEGVLRQRLLTSLLEQQSTVKQRIEEERAAKRNQEELNRTRGTYGMTPAEARAKGLQDTSPPAPAVSSPHERTPRASSPSPKVTTPPVTVVKKDAEEPGKGPKEEPSSAQASPPKVPPTVKEVPDRKSVMARPEDGWKPIDPNNRSQVEGRYRNALARIDQHSTWNQRRKDIERNRIENIFKEIRGHRGNSDYTPRVGEFAELPPGSTAQVGLEDRVRPGGPRFSVKKRGTTTETEVTKDEASTLLRSMRTDRLLAQLQEDVPQSELDRMETEIRDLSDQLSQFSRAPEEIGGSKREDLKRWVEPIQKRAKGAAALQIVQSQGELPKHITTAARSGTVVEGVFDPKTKSVYLVADNIPNKKVAVQKWLHEQVGHVGLRGTFGNDVVYQRFLHQAYGLLANNKQTKDLMESVVSSYGFNVKGTKKEHDLGKMAAAEELLARRAEVQSRAPGLWRQILASFRRFLDSWLPPGVLDKHEHQLSLDDIDMVLNAAKGYTLKGWTLSNQIEAQLNSRAAKISFDKELLKGAQERVGKLATNLPKFQMTDDEYVKMILDEYKKNPDARFWYDLHQKEFNKLLGPDADILNVIVAETSPMSEPGTNLVWAVETYAHLLGIKGALPSAKYPNKIADRVKNWKSLEGFIKDAVLKYNKSSPKVPEFRWGLLGDPNATVNDRWMKRILFESTAGYDPDADAGLSTLQHLSARQKMLQLTKLLRERTGEQWTPREVQATLWTAGRSRRATAKDIASGTANYLVALDKRTGKSPNKRSAINGESPREWLLRVADEQGIDLASGPLMKRWGGKKNVIKKLQEANRLLEKDRERYFGLSPLADRKTFGVHYKNTLIPEGGLLKASQLRLDEEGNALIQNSYSHSDLGARMVNRTKRNPYQPLVYFYEAGTVPESQLGSKPVRLNVEFDNSRIYDSIKDPDKLHPKVVKEMIKDPEVWYMEGVDPTMNGAYTNVLARLVKQTGRYDGLRVRDPRSKSGRWTLIFDEVAVTHGFLDNVNVGISDTVESLHGNVQDIDKLDRNRSQVPAFEKRMRRLNLSYPEITLNKVDTSIGQFDGATTGMMELGAGLTLSGPSQSVRAYLAELGIEHNQGQVYLMRPVESKGQRNGVLFDVVTTAQSAAELKGALERAGVTEFNMIRNQLGEYSVRQFVLEDTDAIARFEKVAGALGKRNDPRNTVFDVNSEVLGDQDYSGDPNTAMEGYRKELVKFHGEVNGEKRYQEALRRQGAFLAGEEGGRQGRDGAADRQVGLYPDKGSGDDRVLSQEGKGKRGRVNPPKKTVKAYKLFRTLKTQPGKIFPLFIGKSTPTAVGEWIPAEYIPTKGFAQRPGWHVGVLPRADHLLRKDGTMAPDRVWAEVEIPADVNWQERADKSPTKDIQNEVPAGGYYRFKRPASQGGEWRIAGEIKVNRILAPEDVSKILEEADNPSEEWVINPDQINPGARPSFSYTLNDPDVRSDVESRIDAIGGEKLTTKTRIKRAMGRLKDVRTGLMDRFAPLDRLEKTVGGVQAPMSGYKSLRMLSSLPTIMEQVLERGDLRFQDQWSTVEKSDKGGLLNVFRDLGNDTDDFLLWMTGLSAQEMIEKDRGPIFGKSKSDDQSMVDGLLLRGIGKDEKKWTAARARLHEINNNMLNFAERAGVINKDQRAQWEREDYIPFNRLMESYETGDLESMFGTGESLTVQGIRRLEGSDLTLGDGLENLVNAYTFLTRESLKNLAHKKSLKLMLENGLAEEVSPKTTSKGGIVGIRENGREQKYKIADPELFEALADTTAGQAHGLLKFFSFFKKTLTFGVTLTPAFRIANLMRDTLSTGVLEGQMIRQMGRALAGFRESWSNSPLAVEYRGTGGAFGSSIYRADNPESVATYVRKKTRARKGRRGIVLQSMKDFVGLWDRVGNAAEEANRLALYKRQKVAGKSSFEAGFNAKDLMDFHLTGRAGIVRTMIQMVPFLNARIQGLYKLGRNATGRETAAGFFARGSLLAMASLALAYHNEDDERYQDLPDYEKFGYFHTWIGDQHVRIPIPFEVGVIFGTGPTAIMETMRGKEDLEHLKKWAAQSFYDTLSFNPIPQAIKPGLEVWANKNSFTSNPIVGMGQRNLPPELQYGPWTSETAKLMGRWTRESLRISPKKLDHLIQNYFAGAGKVAIFMTDQLINQFSPDRPARPSTDVRDNPIYGRFLRGNTQPRSTRWENELYDLIDRADEAFAGVRQFRKIGDRNAARELEWESRTLLSQRKFLGRQRRQLGTIYKQMQMIYEKKSMSAEKKREALDGLLRRKQRITKQAVERYRKQEERRSR